MPTEHESSPAMWLCSGAWLCRTVYRQTVRGFREFCGPRGGVATVGLAREYVSTHVMRKPGLGVRSPLDVGYEPDPRA